MSEPLKVKKLLDLSENILGDKAAKELAEYFSGDGIEIDVLDLGKNGMTREGLRRVKEIIRANDKIKELVVRGNKEIEESVEACERRMRSKETF